MAQILDQLNLSKLGALFEDQEVDESTLLCLNKECFLEMGIDEADAITLDEFVASMSQHAS